MHAKRRARVNILRAKTIGSSVVAPCPIARSLCSPNPLFLSMMWRAIFQTTHLGLIIHICHRRIEERMISEAFDDEYQ